MSDNKKPYSVWVSIQMKAYLDEDNLYHKDTRDMIIDMLGSDIADGWITRSEANIRYVPITEIPWEDDYNPWEAAREDAAVE